MTIIHLCPFMEEETQRAVERANDLPADKAVQYLDDFIFAIVPTINRTIDDYILCNDTEDTKDATVEQFLKRWDHYRDHLRAMRFGFWMEKWFPLSEWDFKSDN